MGGLGFGAAYTDTPGVVAARARDLPLVSRIAHCGTCVDEDDPLENDEPELDLDEPELEYDEPELDREELPLLEERVLLPLLEERVLLPLLEER